MERYIAIDNVCAWPNLTMLRDGTIIATIFDQPCHGLWEGDVACGASSDGGRLWERRGAPAPHEPGTNRMNVAAGLAAKGDLLVIASGWSDRPGPGVPRWHQGAHILTPWVCRSADGGRTWERAATVAYPDPDGAYVPFGDIVGGDGVLAASFYSARRGGSSSAYLFRSHDDGRTWGDVSLIAPDDYNETAILRLTEGRWLAACRTSRDGHLELWTSDDEGRNWRGEGALTLPGQHPAHLAELADGRILLVYGIRNRGLYGVGARLSADRGRTWGAPSVLADFGDATDGGYPASVQLADGTVVTAHYANRVPMHHRYHMGITRWQPDTP